MRRSELETNAEVIAEDLASDPGFRATWERTARTRTLSPAALRYRTDRGLSQTCLAKRLVMSPRRIVRLGLGEDDPTIDTLTELSSGLGAESTIRVRPSLPPDLVAVAV